MNFKLWLENASNVLYHTTSFGGLEDILHSKQIKANPFVSLSEIPLFGGDIRGTDVAIGLNAGTIAAHILKVDYSEEWFGQHPEHGAYIAGEGWREQWSYDPPEDEEGDLDWDDDEGYEDAYRAAEIDSFLWKSAEREWITKREYAPLPIPPATVQIVVVHDRSKIPAVQKMLQEYRLRIQVVAG